MKKECLIIAASAGVGKSYLGKKYKNVLDLESSPFRWTNKGLENLSEGEQKGLDRGELNPNWPQNYIDKLLISRNKYDIILIPIPHETMMAKEIGDYLTSQNMVFYIAMPTEESIETILKRLKDRGNEDDFVDYIRTNYPVIINEFTRDKCNLLTILDGEYLEDTLIRYGMLGDLNEQR